MSYSDSDVRSILEDFPHGGGEYYSESEGKLHPDDADVTVSTLSGLEDECGPNITIGIDTNSIDFGSTMVNIGQSTLVGDRGWDGSDGPLFHTNTEGYVSVPWSGSTRPYSMLWTSATSGSPRVSGLRIRGASHDRANYAPSGDYDDTLSRGVLFRGDRGEVDNCEIYGWMWNGVHARGNFGQGTIAEVDLHHSHLHTSKQDGYGYGADTWGGWMHIDHCYFNDARHSIDGFGYWNTGYDVNECVFGPDQLSHMVDMHCLTENSSSSNTDPSAQDFGLRAGGEMTLRNSTFLNGSVGVMTVRGEPWDFAEIHNNWISHSSIPTSNSGNNRSGAWYQQNVHGATGHAGESYAPLADDGEYTSAWSDSDNATGASDSSVAWSSDYGASIDFENPENSPAYQGYASEPDDPDPEDYPLSFVVEDASGNAVEGATVSLWQQ